VLLFILSATVLAVGLLVAANLLGPKRWSRVKRMPYESGMDPIHDTRRRFDVRFHLLAVAFLVFDVELLFLYPWAVTLHRPVAERSSVAAAAAADEPAATPAIAADGPHRPGLDGRLRPPYLFAGGMLFIGLLALGLVYDWRKGIFEWR
jgi:NADH-quinone oxidoreductase subunit A